MTRLISQQLLNYLESFEGALQMSPEHSQSIVREIRGDLSAQIQHLVDEGMDEESAVQQAIEDLGPPDTLASQIRTEVPPINGPLLRTIRRFVAIAMTLLIAWLCWNIRAGFYGFSVSRALGIGTCYLSILLLIWPNIIWRKNWMFSALPAAIVVIAVFLMLSLGQATETTQVIDLNAPPAIPSPPDNSRLHLIQNVTLGAFVLLAGYLILMMQQRRQRITMIAIAVLLIVAVELPYAIEESSYASDLQRVRTYLETAHREQGTYPQRSGTGVANAIGSFTYATSEEGEQYNLYWKRPLSRGYQIGFGSKKQNRWIID